MSNYTTKEEFESAYKTLNATFKTGRTRDLRWRKWQLKQLYWMLDENEDLFTEAIQKDLNKPSFEVWFMELNAVKQDILDQLNNIEKWSKGEAPEGAGFLFGTLGKAWLRKAPLGVCLVIGAWNFPLQTLLAPACGALGAGMFGSDITMKSHLANLSRQLHHYEAFGCDIGDSGSLHQARAKVPRPICT